MTVAPASAIEADTSQWPQEQLEPEVSTAGNHNDVVNDATASSPYLFEDHKPGATEKAIYGIKAATRRALHRWLRHAADVIFSGNQPKIDQACRDHAQSEGLHGELAREILIHRIEVGLAL